MPWETTLHRFADNFDVIDRMKDLTGSSLSMIYGCVADDAGELVGSGTIISLRGLPYPVTAHHIVMEAFKRAYNEAPK